MLEMMRAGLAREVFSKVVQRKPKFPQMPETLDEVFIPGQNTDVHNGFANCKNNPIGLQARFYKTKKGGIGGIWERDKKNYEGYPGLVHGGMTATFLDEIMTNVTFHGTGQFGLTVKADFQYLKPVPSENLVKGWGHIVFRGQEFVKTKAYLFREDGKVAVISSGTFYMPTVSHFKKILELTEVPEDAKQYLRP